MCASTGDVALLQRQLQQKGGELLCTFKAVQTSLAPFINKVNTCIPGLLANTLLSSGE